MLEYVSAFDWDSGNRDKCSEHGVSLDEIEFVLRGEQREAEQFVRPISARYLHQNEVRHYEAQTQVAPQAADDAL